MTIACIAVAISIALIPIAILAVIIEDELRIQQILKECKQSIMISHLKNWAIFSASIAFALFFLYALIGGAIWISAYFISMNMGPFGVLTIVTIIVSIIAGFFLTLDD
jgi:TRAP-type mannitol/chloroaromatic compound transport system permease large subunit